MKKEIRGKANVRVTVEVDVGVWGNDCTLEQLLKQSAESALNKVRKQLGDSQMRIVGEPSVTAVLGKPA